MQSPRKSLVAITCAAMVTASGTVVVPADAQTAKSSTTEYRLGPGDTLNVKVYQLDGETTTTIHPDGRLVLPRIAPIEITGRTVEEARTAIQRSYKSLLRRPVVYIDLVRTRPVTVTVTGEVQRAGLYSLPSSSAVAGETDVQQKTVRSSGRRWPTIVDAIQTAGGITADSDLKNITVTRTSDSGRETTQRIDFWKALNGNGPITNPQVYDGDMIRIPRVEVASTEVLDLAAKSNLAPAKIKVKVVGEVVSPGEQGLQINSTLDQAILSAGGLSKRASSNTIELVRLLPNGRIERKVLTFKAENRLGTQENPRLRDGDIVVVDRHAWAKTTDGIKSLVEPVGPLLNAASIFRIFAL